MAISTAPIVAHGVVRAAPASGLDCVGWRKGPDTLDGTWMVTTSRGANAWAVRVIIDPDAPKLSSYEMYYALEAALHARSYEAQDEYLAAITVVSDLAPNELTRLRDAVVAGRTGGAADGAPRKRTRKAADR